MSYEACSTPLSAGDLQRIATVDLLRRRADAGIAEAAVLLQQYQTCRDSFMARPGPSLDTDPQTANAATVLRALACQYHDKRHRSTCFKSQGRILCCRFRFPRDVVARTTLFRVEADGNRALGGNCP